MSELVSLSAGLYLLSACISIEGTRQIDFTSFGFLNHWATAALKGFASICNLFFWCSFHTYFRSFVFFVIFDLAIGNHTLSPLEKKTDLISTCPFNKVRSEHYNFIQSDLQLYVTHLWSN